jgi:hypothetical protein
LAYCTLCREFVLYSQTNCVIIFCVVIELKGSMNWTWLMNLKFKISSLALLTAFNLQVLHRFLCCVKLYSVLIRYSIFLITWVWIIWFVAYPYALLRHNLQACKVLAIFSQSLHLSIHTYETTWELLNGFSWKLIVENFIEPCKFLFMSDNFNDHFTWNLHVNLCIFWA